jgi:hypothetical protein
MVFTCCQWSRFSHFATRVTRTISSTNKGYKLAVERKAGKTQPTGCSRVKSWESGKWVILKNEKVLHLHDAFCFRRGQKGCYGSNWVNSWLNLQQNHGKPSGKDCSKSSGNCAAQGGCQCRLRPQTRSRSVWKSVRIHHNAISWKTLY